MFAVTQMITFQSVQSKIAFHQSSHDLLLPRENQTSSCYCISRTFLNNKGLVLTFIHWKFRHFVSSRVPETKMTFVYWLINKGWKFLKKLWCCVGAGNKVIWLYQLKFRIFSVYGYWISYPPTLPFQLFSYSFCTAALVIAFKERKPNFYLWLSWVGTVICALLYAEIY